MLKQKLILKAVENFKHEIKIIRDEAELLKKREDLVFERFLERCKDIHAMTFMERWREAVEEEKQNVSCE